MSCLNTRYNSGNIINSAEWIILPLSDISFRCVLTLNLSNVYMWGDRNGSYKLYNKAILRDIVLRWAWYMYKIKKVHSPHACHLSQCTQRSLFQIFFLKVE